CMQDVQLPLTF
nr:immunoglobulin light chain junction region [Macaca mulatta]MOW09487.1 immunoglobulin light chain junction region [Macaca mulatta]MOW14782.1 immunoglobulin light chain junction region [Macaca mulatta]MOX07408.1 immunoglobulin light chain junction region [Macaca mulatta]MOX07443.1 immunoglobulin light chain junction region [Macaca mulatta]